MAQVTDRTVGANPAGFDMRTELNNIISALESDNSGSSEPLNTVAYMKWLDTSNATYYYYKERNHDNTAWITLFRYTVATKIMEAVSNGVVLSQTDIASEIHASSSKTTPVNADEIGLIDSASTFTLKKLTWANLKDTLKTYLDTLYQSILVSGTNIKTINSNSILGSGNLVITSSTPQVRQTVLSGAVDTSGFSAFGGSTGSTTVTSTSTLVATCADGTNDRIGTIVNPSWTGLSTNGTMYLYLNIATDGTCTTGSTTLAPTYRWGGADVVTNLQNTFNIQEMKMKVGNGSTATQVYRVFVGEVIVASAVVSAIVWYAVMGRYQGVFVNTLPAPTTAISLNHNMGITPDNFQFEIKCIIADINYAVGDVVRFLNAQMGSYNYPLTNWATYKTCGFTMPSTQIGVVGKSGGAIQIPTLASWAYRMTAQRGW